MTNDEDPSFCANATAGVNSTIAANAMAIITRFMRVTSFVKPDS